MRGKKRAYIWVTLLTAGALGVSGGKSLRVNATSEPPDFSEAILSFNMTDETGLPQYEADIWNDEDSDDPAEIEQDLEGGVGEPENGEEEILSDNKEEIPSDITDLSGSALSDNGLVTDTEDKEAVIVSEEQSMEEDREDKPLDVILPVEVPFDITILGEEGLDGLIRSKQYCIENRGCEDVCVSVEGVCSGNEAEEDYVVSGFPVKEDFVQGKKNIWLCLRWEDEERKVLDQPGIVMGGDQDPGKGEIILKAPVRDEDGEIIDGNNGSRAYFSFAGELKSDMDRPWRDGELQVKLEFSMEPAAGKNTDPSPNRAETAEMDMELMNEDAEVQADMGAVNEDADREVLFGL